MRKIKKDVKGEASQYLTRSNAIRKMQLSLQDFRKICILKGIYPREPRKKFKGNDKTYYHIKDLKILEHDQLLEKFRDIKAHLKKHKKLLGRREIKLAEKHLKKTPKYLLAPVIKDRYPTFVDALTDLDDALCLVSLFAQFPQHLTLEINKKELETCRQLYRDFMYYCTLTQCFTKAFFSIKGIYYRVEIMGQQVTWVAPYKFNQRLPFDVDYKVMGTFTEFYIGLLKFINYKLFSDCGMAYPVAEYPVASSTTYLDSQKVRDIQTKVRKLFDQGENAEMDEAFKASPEMEQFTKRQEQSKRQRKLLADTVFLLGRETPVYILQHLILSLGGQYVLQEELPEDEKDLAKVMKSVTHVCMDRPLAPGQQEKSKEYIQPQYVLDSLNNMFLLPTRPYLPGIAAPSHLSPFVDNEVEGYIPDRQREINTLAGIETTELPQADDSSEDEAMDNKKAEPESDSDVEGESDSDEDGDEATEAKKPSNKGDLDSSSDEEVSDDESEDAAAKGKSSKQVKKAQKIKNTRADRIAKTDKIKRDLEKEQQEMGKMLMTKRQRQAFQKAEQSKQAKKVASKKLIEKKKILSKKK